MRDRYEVSAVRYATRVTLASEVYLNFHTYGAEDFELVMDYFFWVVRNEQRTVIVDTGFTSDVGVRRGRTMTCPVPDGLARIGVDPGSVEHVLITHGHYDHVGNVNLFTNANVFICGTEIDFWSSAVASRFQFSQAIEKADIDHLHQLASAGRLHRISGSAEVVPGIKAIEVGGHTPGQLVAVVDGENGPVMLASDAVHYYDEVELDRPFLIVADLAKMYETYDFIASFAETEGASVVAGHDPIVLERFAALDPSEPGFGVRI